MEKTNTMLSNAKATLIELNDRAVTLVKEYPEHIEVMIRNRFDFSLPNRLLKGVTKIREHLRDSEYRPNPKEDLRLIARMLEVIEETEHELERIKR